MADIRQGPIEIDNGGDIIKNQNNWLGFGYSLPVGKWNRVCTGCGRKAKFPKPKPEDYEWLCYPCYQVYGQFPSEPPIHCAGGCGKEAKDQLFLFAKTFSWYCRACHPEKGNIKA